jgi:hypothetical protein
MSDREILNIFISVTQGVGNHGSFLQSFALTLVRADYQNFALLKPVALALIDKYKLNTPTYTKEQEL